MEPEFEQALVAEAMAALRDVDVPDVLRDCIARHERYLVGLVRGLTANGLSEEAVKQAIAAVLNSYKDELVNAIMLLQEDHRDQ